MKVVRRKIPKVNEWKKQQLISQGGTCYYCPTKLTLQKKHVNLNKQLDYATKEHLIPLTRGGKNNKENLALACPPCNNEKGDMTEEEFRNRRTGSSPTFATLRELLFKKKVVKKMKVSDGLPDYERYLLALNIY